MSATHEVINEDGSVTRIWETPFGKYTQVGDKPMTFVPAAGPPPRPIPSKKKHRL